MTAGYIDIQSGSEPSNPPSGFFRLFGEGGAFKVKDDAGGIGVLGSSPERVFTVEENGKADFDKLEDAIAAVNALMPAPDAFTPAAIRVFPGTYTVPNTQVVPEGTTIEGIGFPIITTAVTSNPVFELTNNASALRNLVIFGASGAGGVGVQFTGGTGERAQLIGCVISGNETGIEVVSPDDLGILANFFNIFSNNTTGLRITDGTLFQRDDTFQANTSLDLEVLTADARFLSVGASFSQLTANIDSAATAVGAHISEVDGDESYRIMGEFSVGHPDEGHRAGFGKGTSSALNITALTNTNGEIGTWADITTQLESPLGSVAALFPGTAAENTFYLGHPEKFVGLDNIVSTAMVLGSGAVAVEFWNGAAWVGVNHMSTTADDSPPQQYADALWERVDDEHVRFDDMPGWAQKSLNGTTAYWIRVRITSAITTVPQAQHMKPHFDSTEISRTGQVTLFGAAEPKIVLPTNWSNFNDVQGFPAGNVFIDYSPQVSVLSLDADFDDGSVNAVGTLIQIPSGLDTSKPIELSVQWIPKSTGGDVELQTVETLVREGDTLDGTLAETFSSKVVTAPATNVLVTTTFQFDVSELTPSDFLAITLFRDAMGGNADDTLLGDVHIVRASIRGFRWLA